MVRSSLVYLAHVYKQSESKQWRPTSVYLSAFPRKMTMFIQVLNHLKLPLCIDDLQNSEHDVIFRPQHLMTSNYISVITVNLLHQIGAIFAFQNLQHACIRTSNCQQEAVMKDKMQGGSVLGTTEQNFFMQSTFPFCGRD